MFKNGFLKSAIAITALASMLTGCSVKKIKEDTQKTLAHNQQVYSQAVQKEQARFDKTGIKADIPLLAGERVEIKKDELPPFFHQQVTYNTTGETFAKIVQDVLSGFGVSASFTEAYANDAMLLGGMSATPAPVSTDSGNAASETPVRGGALSQALLQSRSFEFSGDLKAFLDQVADKLELSWRYDKNANKVVFYKFKTRTFSISLPRSAKKLSSSISLSGGGNGGGSVSISSSSSIDTWKALLGGIRTMLGGGASTSTVSASQGAFSVKGEYGIATAYPDLGYLTVMARPFVLDRIAKYVESVNRQFSRNILIDVKVINLSMNRNANVGFSFEWLKEKLGEYKILLSPGGLLTPSSGNAPGMLSIKNISGTETASALMNVLASLGDVSIKTQGQVVAVNGQPAPFQQAQEITYVKNVTIQNTANVGTTQAPQTETKVVGFTANFLPVLLKDGRILLEYQIQNSTLVGFQSIAFGDTTLQLPQVSSQSLQNHAVMRDGQSLMLFSFEREQATSGNQQGLSALSFDTGKKKDMAIILLTVKVDKKQY